MFVAGSSCLALKNTHRCSWWARWCRSALPVSGDKLSRSRYEPAGEIELVSSTEREIITQPLLTGTIASTRQTVYFVITDASDEEFAEIPLKAMVEHTRRLER